MPGSTAAARAFARVRPDSVAVAASWRRKAARYRRDGYMVAPRLFDRDRIAALRAEITAIGCGERGAVRGLPTDAATLGADQVLHRYLCVHHPHKISAVMQAALTHAGVVAALGAAVGPNVKCMQSMLFIKGPGKPGQEWHQDEFFIPTRDRSLCGVWIALDDATTLNGCLWVLPGSHRPGVLYPTRTIADPRFDGSPVAFDFPWPESEARPVEIGAGGVVFFNGYLLHRSLPNTTPDRFRRALVFHCMSAESLLPWDDEGRLPATDDMRDVVLVRGVDPYARKGTGEVLVPYLRETSY
ncbi:MAG TPA: phytanoyl-CoA dioxygenase family protein [Dongiaceae bacterium]|nr:phytanoyl-CoA dioxygenase family protein [Dongiaceae bacterium]